MSSLAASIVSLVLNSWLNFGSRLQHDIFSLGCDLQCFTSFVKNNHVTQKYTNDSLVTHLGGWWFRYSSSYTGRHFLMLVEYLRFFANSLVRRLCFWLADSQTTPVCCSSAPILPQWGNFPPDEEDSSDKLLFRLHRLGPVYPRGSFSCFTQIFRSSSHWVLCLTHNFFSTFSALISFASPHLWSTE